MKNPVGTVTMIKRALLSVSDKTGLEELAHSLIGYGIELLATGGTANALKRANIPFRSVESFTGNPEAFDGRMKTISFKLESAILYDRTSLKHVEEAQKLGIEPIDLVVCNFYPFEEAVARGKNESDWISETDIGGPTMVRAAAKNFSSVSVLTTPHDYSNFVQELRMTGGGTRLEFRKKLMIKAFERTAQYDQSIFEAFARQSLRYGENPHQQAYFIPQTFSKSGIDWELIEKSDVELSYNNFLDAQAAYSSMKDAFALKPPGHGVCSIIKHNNPCGLATAPTLPEAFERAWEGDPVSSFGGVVAFSSPLTVETARLFDKKFVEVILAPGFEEEAISELKRKKKKLRLLRINHLETHLSPNEFFRTKVDGGYLVCQPDYGVEFEEFRAVTRTKFPQELEGVARFSVAAAKWIKSNAIAIARIHPDQGYQLVGMGSGQPNRVDAVRRLAIPKAKDVLGQDYPLSQCVLASDAFFPFPDNIEEAHAAGIRYIVQPGGSIRDKEIIECCEKLGVAMAFTGKRHFRH